MMLMCLVCAALCAAPETSPAPAAPAASVHRAQIAIRDPFVLPVKDEGLYYMYGTKVYGTYAGTLILDDCTVLDIHDFAGFAERSTQRW